MEDGGRPPGAKDWSQEASAIIQAKSAESQDQGTDLETDKAFYGHQRYFRRN